MRNLRWGTVATAAIAAGALALSSQTAMGAETSRETSTRTIRLTADGRSYAPRGLGWSPTGELIAYYRSDESGRQLMVRDVDGRQVRPVSPAGAPPPAAWSPDGKHIAYVFGESSEDQSEARVYVWSRDTGQSAEVARGYRQHQFGDGTGYGVPVWSPDGTRFVWKVRRVLNADEWRFAPIVFSVDGSPAVQLAPNHYNSGAWYPATWSPDSQELAFCSRTSETAGRGVWLATADGTELRELVGASTETFVGEPMWSPDGQWIAYGSDANKGQDERDLHDIWLVRPDGSESHPLTQTASDTTEGRMRLELYTWSPDAARLCTVGWRLDALGVRHGGLYVVDAQTGALTEIFANSREKVEVITKFEHTHVWSPRGDRIAFMARRSERQGEPGPDQQLTQTHDFVGMYDVRGERLDTPVETWPDEEGVRMTPGWWHWMPSWGPSGAQLLFMMGRVLSLADEDYEPDLYRLEIEAPQPVSEPSAEAQPAAAPTSDRAPGSATMVFPRHRRAQEIAEALPEGYRGIYKVDAGLNALVASSADDETLNAFHRDVELLDREVPQVMVDVLVTEMSDDASRRLGLDWEYVRGSLSAALPIAESGAGEVIYRGVGTFDKSFFATLSALEEQGQAKVRANPRVLARCGSQATINIRRTDNFFFDAGTDYQGHPVRARSDISADIILRIVPQILASGDIAMAVDATVDSFIFGGRDELPDTTRRQAVTDVVCGDGETIVIGGLTQEEHTVKRQKTPVLGDLPLLGQLFRHTSRSVRESTLVIFVTPRAIVP